MKISTILFDLDGTLLPMDNDEFTKGYFKLLVKKLAPYGYEPQKLIDGIWAGTAAMVKNDGTKSNEQGFWEKFDLIPQNSKRRNESQEGLNPAITSSESKAELTSVNS